jgi:methionyl aminopeptidase
MEKAEIDAYVKAGEIAKEVKGFARGLIEPGVKLIDVAEAVDAKIVELGGDIAFPVNLSLNEVAAHYTPEPGDDKVAEGILKVDIGVCVDGYIADTAFSVDLTEDGEFGDMIKLNEEILANVTEVIKPGVVVKDVGDVAQDVLEKSDGDYSIIKGLSGHVLGRNVIHAGLTISNYRNDNVTELDDVAFAVEPFVTSGVGDIYEGPVGGIYVLQSDGQVRDRDARLVLKYIKEKFEGRPFCLRFLVDEFDLSVAKLRFILKGMVKSGVLYEYPQLIEKSRAPVSQAENTFVVSGGEVVCTTG